ncbi:major allergen I polypeptide chain 2-like [Meles meles]|uniref:major allergen I polypeptide chain 2-like n=1 Tax=Meles meles TaxID=9662 RepID=UPI001E69B419|nr:major allergen I polypeptide chain 2-like [Meles meles]
MKGTLLVLALLVTQELGIKMVKSCPIFYTAFGALALGEKTLLDLSLDPVGATEPEKKALEKIQDCYNEKGPEAKFLDLIVMVDLDQSVSYSVFPKVPIVKGEATITTSKQCLSEAMAPLKNAVAPLKDAVASLGR